MSNSHIASNAIAFGDGNSNLVSAIFPSSFQSGAAAIGTFGNDATLLSLEDVKVLRDQLDLCLEQAAQSSPFAVVEPNLVPLPERFTEQYLAGHLLFPGAVETEDGVLAPARSVVQAIVYDALQHVVLSDALDITAADITNEVLSVLND